MKGTSLLSNNKIPTAAAFPLQALSSLSLHTSSDRKLLSRSRVSPMCSHWAHFVNSPQPQGSHVGGPHPITGRLWLWAASSVPFPMVSGTEVVSFCVSHTVNKVRKHCYVIRFKAITSGCSRGAYIIPPLPPASALRDFQQQSGFHTLWAKWSSPFCNSCLNIG